MKNLFISYYWESEVHLSRPRDLTFGLTTDYMAHTEIKTGIDNIVLIGDNTKLSTESDIKVIEAYIEGKFNYNKVKINIFRRME